MLLSEALAERKAALKAVGTHTEALKAAVVRYEDMQPEGDPGAIEQSLLDAIYRFRDLTVRINRTNNATNVTFDGRTMTVMEAVAVREELLLATRAYKAVFEDANEKVSGRSRYTRRTKDDVRHIAVQPLDAVSSARDESAANLRVLDMEIQKVNWTTELLP